MAVRWGRFALAAATVVAAGYLATFGWLVHSAPLSFHELDLDHDGGVTFGEASYAASYGERLVQLKGQQCKEYFAYKDGLPLKVVCPEPV